MNRVSAAPAMGGPRETRRGLIGSPLLLIVLAAALLTVSVMVADGAEVADVSRYAPAGPAPNAEFEVTLTLTGNAPVVVGIIETIPEGFSFMSTTCENYQVSGQQIAFAVIDELAITYKVQAPASGEGTFTGSWVDLLSANEGKIADTIVMVGGGGAGAIEGGSPVVSTPTPTAPTVTKASRTIPALVPFEEVAMLFEDMDITLLALTADAQVSDVKIELERVAKPGVVPAPSGTVYSYLTIDVIHEDPAKLEGRIECKVPKSWLTAHTIDESTVALCRYEPTGGWVKLATVKTTEDTEYSYYEARTSGFSLFAITAMKATPGAATPTPVATPSPSGATSTPSPTHSAASSPTTAATPGFEAVVTAFSLLTAGFGIMKRLKGGAR
jgi:PGF-pre-PGF domain-containing protein